MQSDITLQRKESACFGTRIQRSQQDVFRRKAMNSFTKQLAHKLSNSKVLMPILTVAIGVVMGCSIARAQSGAGSIQGTVTDATSAVIPGASIHVVNQATGVAVDTKSNSVGFYQVPGLFTGTYVVTITTPKMKTYVQRIELLVAQNATINATMTPGSVTQQVQVNAETVQLTTTDSGNITATLENDRINQLPMNGRSLITLTNETTPGMEACNQSPSCANGLMPAAVAYIVDGATVESREFGGASGVSGGNPSQYLTPDPDSVQEVQMETSGVGAQYGVPVVGLVTTKSGTNQLHGTMFETSRNNYWGVAKAKAESFQLRRPPLSAQ